MAIFEEPPRRPISDRLLRNAKIMLKVSCRATQGETLLLLADETLLPYGPGIATAALELGLIPTIMDIRHYVASEPYSEGYVLESVKRAMDASDIVIENLADTCISPWATTCGEMSSYMDRSTRIRRSINPRSA